MGINARNLNLVYPNNQRPYFPYVDDKLTCKGLLSENRIPVPETYHIIDNPKALTQWKEKLSPYPAFVIKPNHGFGGNGILLVKQSDSGYLISSEEWGAEDIDFHISQICNGTYSIDHRADKAYAEQMVVSHEDLKALTDPAIGGVADIRIIFMNSSPVMAMLRLPTKLSGGKANLHQGGIGVGIDLETGLTRGGCFKNDPIENNFETGVTLSGWPVPGFGQMLEYGSRISKIVNLGYIGVDFVCDQNSGPMVLEVNARPGLNIQIANRQGIAGATP